jgi:hypothetical protein
VIEIKLSLCAGMDRFIFCFSGIWQNDGTRTVTVLLSEHMRRCYFHIYDSVLKSGGVSFDSGWFCCLAGRIQTGATCVQSRHWARQAAIPPLKLTCYCSYTLIISITVKKKFQSCTTDRRAHLRLVYIRRPPWPRWAAEAQRPPHVPPMSNAQVCQLSVFTAFPIFSLHRPAPSTPPRYHSHASAAAHSHPPRPGGGVPRGALRHLHGGDHAVELVRRRKGRGDRERSREGGR